jgi:hypothetical protein
MAAKILRSKVKVLFVNDYLTFVLFLPLASRDCDTLDLSRRHHSASSPERSSHCWQPPAVQLLARRTRWSSKRTLNGVLPAFH